MKKTWRLSSRKRIMKRKIGDRLKFFIFYFYIFGFVLFCFSNASTMLTVAKFHTPKHHPLRMTLSSLILPCLRSKCFMKQNFLFPMKTVAWRLLSLQIRAGSLSLLNLVILEAGSWTSPPASETGNFISPPPERTKEKGSVGTLIRRPV